MTQTAQLFTATGHLDFNVIGRHNRTGLPYTALPAYFRKVGFQAWIKLKFCLNGLQHRICLVDTVHHNNSIMFLAGHDTPQRKQLGNLRRFTFATRRAHRLIFPFRGADNLRQPAE